jgi:fructokinase
MPLFGGIEAGGTKFICAIGQGPGEIFAETRFPTTNPDQTLNKAARFFTNYMDEHNIHLDRIGIGAFGPLDLDPNSFDFGKVTHTPKPGWSFTDIRGAIQDATSVPITIDTDVNAAALGELTWGAAQGLANFIYLTIGTGIGGGMIVRGVPFHGLVHPEMGHIILPHDSVKDPFPGICPFHNDCFEGLASGPAIEARWKKSSKNLPPNHPAWELEAHYIALGLQAFICIASPQRIILGGGVMEQPQLFPLIRKKVLELLNNYVHSPAILEAIDTYIVPPALGNRAGVLGSIALAQIDFR